MPITYQKFIRRQDLRNNRDQFYVFGDNMQRVGYEKCVASRTRSAS